MSGALPGLASVVEQTAVVATTVAGQVMDDGVTVNPGCVPFPVNVTECGGGGLVALSVIVTVPGRAPVAVGVKLIASEHDAPGATAVPQVEFVSASSA